MKPRHDTLPARGEVGSDAQRPSRVGIRTCVACREEAPKARLIRIVRSPEGSAAVDPTGHAAGRGAYLHREIACIEAARKRRQIERSLSANTSPELWANLASA